MDRTPRVEQQPESRSDIAPRFLLAGTLRLDRNGQWLLPDGTITHPKLRLFLAKNICRNREGEYWIVNGPQRVLVAVADAPYIVVGAGANKSKILLSLNDGSEENLDPRHLFIGRDDAFYSRVKLGQKGDAQGVGHWARFSRNACNQLAENIVESGDGFALRLAGNDYPITNVQRPNQDD